MHGITSLQDIYYAAKSAILLALPSKVLIFDIITF